MVASKKQSTGETKKKQIKQSSVKIFLFTYIAFMQYSYTYVVKYYNVL